MLKSDENLSAPYMSGQRLLSWPELRQRVPLSRTTVWRRIRDGRFPTPLQISPGRVAWLEADILAWITDQKRAI